MQRFNAYRMNSPRPVAQQSHGQRMRMELQTSTAPPSITTKLDGIQAKLQNETDKLVRWKIQTEIEMNMQNRKVEECETIINELKMNALQSQLTNETLSQKLVEEQQNYIEVIEKVKLTRNLMAVVEQQHSQLKQFTSEFKNKRISLEKKVEDNSKDLNGLNSLLNQISLEHQNNMEDINNKYEAMLATSAESYTNLSAELSSVRTALTSAECTLSSTSQDLEECRAEMLKKGKKLESATQEREKLEKERQQMSETLDSVQSDLSGQVSKLFSENKELNETIAKNEEILTEYKRDLELAAHKIQNQENVSKNLEEYSRDLLERIKEEERSKARLTESLAEFKIELTLSEDKVKGMKSELKDTELRIEELNSALHASKEGLVAKEEELANSKSAYDSKAEEVKEMQSRVAELQQQLAEFSSTTEEIISLKDSLTVSSDRERSLEENVVQLKQNLQTLKEELLTSEATICTVSDELTQATEAATQITDEKQKLEETIKEKTKENKELDRELKSTKKSLTAEGKKFTKLRDKLEKMEETLLTLKKEKQTTEQTSKVLYDQLHDDYNTLKLMNEQKVQELSNKMNEQKLHSDTQLEKLNNDLFVRNQEMEKKNEAIEELKKQLNSAEMERLQWTKIKRHETEEKTVSAPVEKEQSHPLFSENTEKRTPEGDKPSMGEKSPKAFTSPSVFGRSKTVITPIKTLSNKENESASRYGSFKRGILKSSANNLGSADKKRVMFSQNSNAYQLDSDSSDSQAIEICSDMEEKLENLLSNRITPAGRRRLTSSRLNSLPFAPVAPMRHLQQTSTPTKTKRSITTPKKNKKMKMDESHEGDGCKVLPKRPLPPIFSETKDSTNCSDEVFGL